MGIKKPVPFIFANMNSTEIQCIAIELNMSGNTYLTFSFYILPKENIVFFLKRLSEDFDFYAKSYKNICILSCFNVEPSYPDLKDFSQDQKLKHLIQNSSLEGYNY